MLACRLQENHARSMQRAGPMPAEAEAEANPPAHRGVVRKILKWADITGLVKRDGVPPDVVARLSVAD